ncbi:MAG: CoA transferase, partial [Chloroflexota bacterium]
MSGIFDGVKVTEFTHYGIGPMTGRYLADHGATVVHVESATRPDAVRTSPPFRDGAVGLNRGGFFSNLNTSKMSVSINLKAEPGLELAHRLTAWADVVVENFAPGVLRRMGLGYEDLVKLNPDLVMISLTNLGQTGPYAGHPGTGTVAQAVAGLVHLLGWPDRGPATPFGAISDFVAPYFGALVVAAALDHRRRTGQGQYIDLSQFEVSAWLIAPALLDRAVNAREAVRRGNRDPQAAPHGAFPAQGDDRWLAIACTTDEEWRALCRAMGQPHLASDPRFATLEARKKNEDELEAMVAAWTRRLPAQDAMHLLQRAGVPAGVVQDMAELYQDPQLQHRQHFRLLDHPEIGPHRHQA